MKRILWPVLSATLMFSCGDSQKDLSSDKFNVKLITLDPGHFHAALVQKEMYADVDSTVKVYAPEGPDVEQHLSRIKAYNSRAEIPTHWNEEVYTGSDYLEKMLEENKADASDHSKKVVVISGNNQKKTEYISKSIADGLNVLADKPMAINTQNFEVLRSAFDDAKKKNVLLYDIMTERYEITSILQRELSQIPAVFGEIEKGTPDNPGITKESIHHFFKYVSGSVLVRPPWFMDVNQAGEGITDVTTHLVDLIQWECFPEEVLDYKKDVSFNSAKRWPTEMTVTQFNELTRQNGFPDYLKKDIVRDSVLSVYCNGEINYALRGIHAKVSVIWNYSAPEGTGDTHYSIFRGTKANLVIRQGKEQNYKPVLFIEPVNLSDFADTTALNEAVKPLLEKYPGIALSRNNKGWEVVIPEQYSEGHEAHFAQVTKKFLEYLKAGKMPEWEIAAMITKYYTTTAALELALKNNEQAAK